MPHPRSEVASARGSLDLHLGCFDQVIPGWIYTNITLEGREVGSVESRRARVAGDTWEQIALHIAETIQKLAGQSLNSERMSD
jgi:hypothetical protein